MVTAVTTGLHSSDHDHTILSDMNVVIHESVMHKNEDFLTSILTYANKVMFLPRTVSWSVCTPKAGLLKVKMNFNQFFGNHRPCKLPLSTYCLIILSK